MPLALHPRATSRSLPLPAAAEQLEGAAGETELDRLIKFVPVEMVAVYVALVAMVHRMPPPLQSGAPFALFLVGIVLIPLVLYADGRATGTRAKWQQYAIRPLVFALWAMTICWPFDPWLPGYSADWPGSLGVVLVPFLGSMLLRESRKRDD